MTQSLIPIDHLQRQLNIIDDIFNGLTNEQIGTKYDISRSTLYRDVKAALSDENIRFDIKQRVYRIMGARIRDDPKDVESLRAGIQLLKQGNEYNLTQNNVDLNISFNLGCDKKPVIDIKESTVIDSEDSSAPSA